MLSEQDKTFLGKIFLNYNFTMTTAQLNKEKLYYRDIQRMLDEGLIEKVKPFSRCSILYGNGSVLL